jgi:antitoxin CptB
MRKLRADVAAQHGYIGVIMPASQFDTGRADTSGTGTPPETPADIRRKRLLFRSWHRGTREADLILGSFAEAYLAGFDEKRLDEYESLLACPDAELFDWIAGRAAPPPEYDTAVTRLLLAFRYTPRAT